MMSEERGIWIITDEATAEEGGKSSIDTGADYGLQKWDAPLQSPKN